MYRISDWVSFGQLALPALTGVFLIGLCLLVTVTAITQPQYPVIIISLPLLLAALTTGVFITAALGLLTTTVAMAIEPAAQHDPALPLEIVLSIALPLIISLRSNNPRWFNDYCRLRWLPLSSAAISSLAEKEARWHSALEGAGKGVWDRNMTTGRTFYSRAWKAMLGYDDHEISDSGSEWSSRIHPDDFARVMQCERDYLTGKTEIFECDFRMAHKDGSYIWIHDRGKVIEWDRQGQPRRMLGIHTDITTRKKDETEIQRLSQRLALALEAGQVGIWEWDLVQQKLFYDNHVQRLFGCPDELCSNHPNALLDRIHPDDRVQVQQALQNVFNGEVLFEAEFRIPLQDGNIRFLRTLGKVISRQNDQPQLMIGTTWDITEQRTLTERLAEEKERLAVTLHSIGDGVICTDANHRVTYLNPVAEQMTGWSRGEVCEKTLGEIFTLVDEHTGQPIIDPVGYCLDRQQIPHLPEDAVLINRSGRQFDIIKSIAPIRTATGQVLGAVLVFQDITRSRELQKKLAYSATHDTLTGLPNRLQFEQRLRQAGQQTLPGDTTHALCFIDLDRFKIVNDTAGHAAGDALLKQLSLLLNQQVRSHDILARLGGDEFGLLLLDCPLTKAEQIARKLIDAVAELRFQWNDRVYRVGASIGLTVIQAELPQTPDELMAEADIACYAAKAAGRNRVSIYRPNASEAHYHRSEIQMSVTILEAMENDRFCLYAQKVQALDPSNPCSGHYELLVRMLDANGKPTLPGAFIPAAERYDLMAGLDHWVISTALRDYGQRIADRPGMSIALNLSAQTLNDPRFPAFIQKTLQQSPLSADRIHFEITETALINHFPAARSVIETLRADGCHIALDDFGAGLCSFSYLKQFPVDYLKIDGSFIKQIKTNRIDRAIVESLHEIAHKLNISTIAEFVEDRETQQILREIGVDYVQGYGIQRPMPLDDILDNEPDHHRHPPRLPIAQCN